MRWHGRAAGARPRARPAGAKPILRVRDRLPDARFEQIFEVLAQDADAEPRRRSPRYRFVGQAGERPVDDSGIGHRARQRADVIQRAAQRHDAVGRISPNAGFRPTRPHAADGMRIEPPVSVPIEASDMPAATATADPPLDPPGDRVGSSGWRTGPNAESSLVVPNANSCRLVLPTSTAPARRSRAVTGGVARRACAVAHVASRPWSARPATSMRSLSEIGMPCSGPAIAPCGQLAIGRARRGERLVGA